MMLIANTDRKLLLRAGPRIISSILYHRPVWLPWPMLQGAFRLVWGIT